ALVPWLLAHPDTPVADVAREFGVTEKQIRADLDLLFVCGLPGYGPGDLMDVVWEGDRVSLSNADTIGRPLRLTADEALALVAALRALLAVPGLVDTAMVEAALGKLEAAAGGVVSADEVAVAVDAVADPEVVTGVADAIASGRRLHLRYWVPARDEATERDVDPIRMFTSDGVPYLVGWCRLVDAVRTFRLDRVLALDVLDLPAEVPAPAQPAGGDVALFTPSEEDQLVSLELAPAARWVADYYPCESVRGGPGDTLVVELRGRDEAWLRRLVLGLAGHVRVVDPPDLAASVQAAAAAALAGYGQMAQSD
ncbi:MAG TPA: WYL domain-containing protein, partial [Mycobacteriales bacterium]|nr:WYL domain-containing protein [Mycobacteriales bacterium]